MITFTDLYAINNANMFKFTTSFNKILKNNPIMIFIQKNKSSIVVQHPEWVRTLCDKPGCSMKTCIGLCGEKTEQKSIAHFTHSDKEEHNPHKLAETDLDGNERPLFAKPYANPHDTSSESYSPESDCEKTKQLEKIIKNIQSDGNKLKE